MPKRDDGMLLRDMIAAGRLAMRETEGKDQSMLAEDYVRTLGMVKSLEILGEAAYRLSTGIRMRYVEIPWAAIIGMRHRLVHAYFEIDGEQIWKTLTEDLPPLLCQLETILLSEFPDHATPENGRSP